MVDITTTSLAAATEGSSYSASFSVANVSGTATWDIVWGRVPNGIDFHANGTWTGTPTESGVFLVTYRVTDSGGSKLIRIPMFVASLAAGATVPIVAPRTTATAPVGLTFDATGTTHAGVPNPFRELSYFWWYDDPTAHVQFTRSAFGGHSFTKPGTYTVTLGVVGPGGTCTVSTQEVTIEDPDVKFAGTNTICVSPTGTFTGAPAGCLQVTASDWKTVHDTHFTQGKRLLLALGETFTVGAQPDPENLNAATLESQIGYFGTPAGVDARGIPTNAPIIQTTAGGISQIRPRGRLITVFGIDCRDTSGANTAASIDAPQSEVIDLSIISCRANTAYNSTVLGISAFVPRFWGSTETHRRFVIAGCDLKGTLYGCYVGGKNYALIGNKFDSDTSHNIRMQYANKTCVEQNEYPGTDGDSHAIKLHSELDAQPGGSPDYSSHFPSPYSEMVGIRDNVVEGISDYLIAVGPQNGGLDEWGRNIIIEGNHVRATKTASSNPVVPIICWWPDCTIRNNEIVAACTTTGTFYGIENAQRSGNPAFLAVQNCVIEHNTIARETGTNAGVFGVRAAASLAGPPTVRNNLVEQAGSTGSYGVVNGTAAESGNLLTATPGFADAGSGDYSLAPGSAAIGAGATGLDVFVDAAVIPRDSAPDVGAYEHYTISSTSAVGALEILTESLPDADQEVPYSQQLTAGGGDPGYTWDIVAGSLPAGLNLVGDTITGTPTDSENAVFTVEVTDSASPTPAVETLELTITVRAKVSITNVSLPPGNLGVPYSEELTAANGTTPYAWSLFAGDLPNGMSVDGEGTVVGQPTEAGSFPVTIRVTDANDVTADLVVTLVISDLVALPQQRAFRPPVPYGPQRRAHEFWQ